MHIFSFVKLQGAFALYSQVYSSLFKAKISGKLEMQAGNIDAAYNGQLVFTG